MVSLVHGAAAADAAGQAADVLFAADPTVASEAAFETLAHEIPFSRLTQGDLSDTFKVLVGAQLASSNGDARRNLSQGAYSVNGVPIDENSDIGEWELLHGRYLLLRKGKKTHHLMEISS
jgi:tyrosyl-tRNA synthetase